MIRADGLEKQYGRFRLSVSFSVPAGRVTGLIGRNGSGKSTLLDCIQGLIRPEKGSLTVLGKEPAAFTAEDRKRISSARQRTFGDSALTLSDWNALQKILLPEYDEEGFLKGCRDLSLPDEVPFKRLSEGQRRALSSLSALCRPAKLLILDEPTAGLDAAAREYLLDRLRVYLSDHDDCTALITSHISSDLEGLCDDLILLEKGKIRLRTETDALYENYGVLKLPEEDWKTLDKSRILASRAEKGIVSCLTDERQFYEENYPGAVIEAGSIDALILLQEDV